MLALGKDSSTLLGATPRLHSAVGTLDDLAHRAMMARAIAFLFAAGATLTLAVLAALPHPEADVAGMLAPPASPTAPRSLVLLRHARIAPAAYPWIVALGTVLITLGIHFRGTPDSRARALLPVGDPLLRLLPQPPRRRSRRWRSRWAATPSSLQSAAHPPDHAPEEWLLTFGALLVACVLIFALRRHVDLTVGGLADAARTDAAHRAAEPARLRGGIRAGARARPPRRAAS